MTSPLISVIVVTYNQHDTIGRALASIVSQRCDYPFEIIIGEDASTDPTRSVCEEFVAAHVENARLMPKCGNKGVVRNYFDCLRQARGRFITDCAGDDFWPEPYRLQRQCEYLLAHPDDVAVMSDWTTIYAHGSVSSADEPMFLPFRRHLSGKAMMQLLLGAVKGFPLLSAMLLRREPLMEVLRHSPMMVENPDWHCEDLSVMCALASKGDFGYVPLTATEYDKSGESVSNSASGARQFDFYIGPARAAVALCHHYGVDPRSIKYALDARLKYLASMLCKAPTGQRRNALMELLAQWPVRQPWKVKLRLAFLSMLRVADDKAKKPD